MARKLVPIGGKTRGGDAAGFSLVKFYDFLTYEKKYSAKNRDIIIQRARYLVETMGINEPSEDVARRVYEELTRRGRSYDTIRHYMVCLELMSEHLGARIKAPRPRRVYKLPEYLDAEEMRRLMTLGCKYQRDYAVIATLCYTGVRLGELLNLRLADVDFKERVLYVRGPTKNMHERVVPLAPGAAEAIRAYIPQRPKSGDGWLFQTVDGEKLRAERVQRTVRSAARRAGIKKRVHVHMLRHSFATLAIRSHVPITSVQKALGHSSLASTLIYTHCGSINDLKKDFGGFII